MIRRIILAHLIFALIGCSQGLDIFDRLIFPGPNFSISAVLVAPNQIKISWTTSCSKTLYAYYIYRTVDSPYNSYDLIARVYNPSVTSTTYTPYTETIPTWNGSSFTYSYPIFDATIPANLTNTPYSGINQYIDTTAFGFPASYYYRVIIYKFSTNYRTVTGTDSAGNTSSATEITYSIDVDQRSGSANVNY